MWSVGKIATQVRIRFLVAKGLAKFSFLLEVLVGGMLL
jgi:hypothetical protein